ncbi:unnamed protein product [Arctia plantaginis]|uniref:Peptidase aspartic putative domain-containing protein n=1 Tax=Arctia plantaginis TaxID=874455 RepID=A0A8S1AZN9_ARCPL|nr:unnamed protein product [Arctia plantaginis]
MAEAKELIIKLEDIFIRISKIRDNIKKCPKARLTRGYLETKLQSLEEYSYKTVNGSLSKIVSRDDRKQFEYFSQDVYGSCEDKYADTKANILDLMGPVLSQSPVTKESVSPQVKLSRIQLPTFSGSYEDWPAFKNLFKSLVHENTSLSEVQKLHYLKLSVINEASILLKHIQVIEANYDKAWQMLIHRYDNKRLIVSSMLTPVVIVKNQEGHSTVLKALIDPGSQGCLITEKAVQLLKCRRYPIKGTIFGVGSTSSRVKHVVQVEVLSKYETESNLKIKAYVISKPLTGQIPTHIISSLSWPHLEELSLADSEYHRPGSIDLLLGVDEYAKILQNDVIKGPPGSPCAQKTSLGWILFGKVYSDTTPERSIIVMHQTIAINDMLKVLWEQDIDNKRKFTEEEETCEKIYKDTHIRNDHGRYVVNLPLKVDPPRAAEGDTRSIALKRLLQLKQKLDKNKGLKESYNHVINEYMELGHIEEVPDKDEGKLYPMASKILKEDLYVDDIMSGFDSVEEAIEAGKQLQDILQKGWMNLQKWSSNNLEFLKSINP